MTVVRKGCCFIGKFISFIFFCGTLGMAAKYGMIDMVQMLLNAGSQAKPLYFVHRL